jgi:hypothetical protein
LSVDGGRVDASVVSKVDGKQHLFDPLLYVQINPMNGTPVRSRTGTLTISSNTIYIEIVLHCATDGTSQTEQGVHHLAIHHIVRFYNTRGCGQ